MKFYPKHSLESMGSYSCSLFFVTNGDTMTDKYICKNCDNEVMTQRYNLGYDTCLECTMVCYWLGYCIPAWKILSMGMVYHMINILLNKQKVIAWILQFILSVGCGFLIAFAMINLMLGCETWDERLWTEYNSCLSIVTIWKELF